MKTSISKTFLICCLLYISMVTINAQNPFMVKANVIINFDVSPNGQDLGYKWWGKDAIAKVSVMNIHTQKVLDVDSVDMKEGSGLFMMGVSFLSNDVLIIGKGKALWSYDIKKRVFNKMFDLPDESFTFLSTSKDKKGIYLKSYRFVYYADIKGGIKNKTALNKDAVVLSFATNFENQLVYSASKEVKGGKTKVEIWSWNGQDEPINLTEHFSSAIENPYLIEPTTDANIFFVAATEGIFRFDISTQKSVKLLDNPKEDPVAIMRFNSNSQNLYYLTHNQKNIIKSINKEGVQGRLITID